MSLRVQIDNKEAAIPRDAEIVLKLFSPFFNDKNEDTTYPLTLNLPANRHIYGNRERFNTDETRYLNELPGAIFWGPFHILEGRNVVTDVNEKDVESFFSTSKHSFWGKANNTKLNELDLGGETFATTDAMLTAFTESLSQQYNYVVCPVHDPFVENIYSNLYRSFYNHLPVGYDLLYAKFHKSIDGKNFLFIPFLRYGVLIEKVITALGYNITRNDLTQDQEFNDIIFISRCNPLIPAVNNETSFKYKNFMPVITTLAFLADVENKCGCRFIVNENSKTVSLISYLKAKTIVPLPALDSLQKHIIAEEDRKRGFIYKDKDNPDTFLKKYYEDKSLEVVLGDEENADQVECISNTIGTEICTEQVRTFPAGEGYYTGYYQASAVSAAYENNDDYKERIETDFRLAVYRGVVRTPSPGTKVYFNYPVASGEPISFATNKMSLLWANVDGYTGLFERFHQKRCKELLGVLVEYEINLTTLTGNLADLSALFAGYVEIRNRMYYCLEQEITLRKDAVISHKIKCYPI